MRQLCLAATALERIGLVHGDIRPGNLLLDADWNLKLSDFDRGMKIGEEIMVLTEPYGRLLDTEEGRAAGTYGIAVLGQRFLLLVKSIIPSYVAMNPTRPNLGAEITLSPSAKNSKKKSVSIAHEFH
jgi:serine/threonine protein kinase